MIDGIDRGNTQRRHQFIVAVERRGAHLQPSALGTCPVALRVRVHRPASHASHVGIADDAVRTMRISGRSCMSFYTRQTKICCVRCGPVDAYFK
ncbi:hypothetical protein SFRURICE_014297 [Spodoptera frugiperda]|nr:hypothetical protein SFRURICE_014297 [Spodoptera frugiperda]